jgi:hypothetical protein
MARETVIYEEWHRMHRGSHPAFSPNLAPSEFYVFEEVEIALRLAVFSDENELLYDVRNTLPGISADKFGAVFANWVTLWDLCIQRGREYGEE